ncbi:hypothetical protein [Paenibacillus illinoisensis]|uniref:hypothetical protein n=1 Tax=Paenibacillus illinoisensis TaxID=59845 RepID=UPI001C8DE6B1|nr:hypothetical protein [Paenibacillus illinoisensis]
MKEWSERFDREPSIFESRPRAAFLMKSKLPSSKVKGDIPAKTIEEDYENIITIIFQHMKNSQ